MVQRVPTPEGPALLTTCVSETPGVYVVSASGPGLTALDPRLRVQLASVIGTENQDGGAVFNE